jgi:hypothetical protein
LLIVSGALSSDSSRTHAIASVAAALAERQEVAHENEAAACRHLVAVEELHRTVAEDAVDAGARLPQRCQVGPRQNRVGILESRS